MIREGTRFLWNVQAGFSLVGEKRTFYSLRSPMGMTKKVLQTGRDERLERKSYHSLASFVILSLPAGRSQRESKALDILEKAGDGQFPSSEGLGVGFT